MSNFLLTQTEADLLISIEKYRSEEKDWDFPNEREKIAIPLQSADEKEHFILDIWRGRVALKRATYQNRARQTVVLVRLDLGGAPHRNPNNEEIECPHIHLYREGYGDKWAEPIPTNIFKNVSNISAALDDFMQYCNITKPPIIQRGLFT